MAAIYYPEISGDALIDEKILDAYDKTEALESGIKDAEASFQEVSKNAGGDPCTTIATANKLTGIVTNITGMVSSASGTIPTFQGFQNNLAMQIILKRLQLCLLYAKRLVVKIKLKIAEVSKKLLIDMTSGKGSGVPDPITTAINAAFIVLGVAINVLLTLIEMFMKMISIGPLGVDAQGMVFFLTPKSMNMSKAPAYNPNSAIGNRFPQVIQMTLFEIEKSVDKANRIIKKAALVSGAALGAVSIMSNNPSFGVSSKLSRVNPGQLHKLIDIASDLIPLPIGMPRYEKLKFTNLGFLAFLITGFEPAAHKSFGIPGYF
jgi:hypothetical protein